MPLSLYYMVRGSVYQSPDVRSVLDARLVSTVPLWYLTDDDVVVVEDKSSLFERSSL